MLFKSIPLLTAVLILFSSQSVHSAEPTGKNKNTNATETLDSRILATLPEQARKLMRDDMLDHLVALNEIITHLSNNNFKDAAEIAENRMGNSSMGKHRGTGMGPGRYMPIEMRNMGWKMHASASEFSRITIQGNLKNSLDALQKVMATCTTCHFSYRTK
jgi:hypothetical protein